MPTITVARLHHTALLPTQGTPGAAGYDVYAHLSGAALCINPGARALVPTGIRMAIPPGWEVQVRPRSGLAIKQGVTVLNTPGTIDSDYRGEVGVILINLGEAPVEVRHGDRIAQLVVAPTHQMELVEGSVKDDTARGSGGFGSTGV